MATGRVLLVDDDSDFVELYKMRLERDGHEVNWAHQGEEGLRMVRTWRPDPIFLDMRMPEMDGIEFLRRLRQDQVAAALASSRGLHRSRDDGRVGDLSCPGLMYRLRGSCDGAEIRGTRRLLATFEALDVGLET